MDNCMVSPHFMYQVLLSQDPKMPPGYAAGLLVRGFAVTSATELQVVPEDPGPDTPATGVASTMPPTPAAGASPKEKEKEKKAPKPKDKGENPHRASFAGLEHLKDVDELQCSLQKFMDRLQRGTVQFFSRAGGAAPRTPRSGR
eukprot:NODE_7315_length_596_cov_36.904051_g7292_i0.p1 GENE.NODE_7315_length_596_cov_36.904051_g7292_i0~~NODE_7315_length_596_cov_36.904051_g7292_i0.p1  ORF type:complete len:168 (-),score=37.38 NODE_7315_length_596_cov_36.904051_g7292_i0:91-522(-)